MQLSLDGVERAERAGRADAASDSIESLYRSHYGGLLAWLQRKLGHSTQAADLAQDTFLRMLTRSVRPSLAELREPVAYLRAIANGLVVDHWRRQALEHAFLEAVAAQGQAFVPSEEDRAIIFDALERIARLLDGMKPNVRTAFLMSHIDGLSYVEIAKRMGVSVRTTERHVAEALYRCHLAIRDDKLVRKGRS
ncbi:MAG: sigma-70 family RNA polymerase sigma factor [Pseudorhodoferax sp.]